MPKGKTNTEKKYEEKKHRNRNFDRSFIIGIVSAGLLDIFGRITGSVEVEGPVFYAHSGNQLEIMNIVVEQYITQ